MSLDVAGVLVVGSLHGDGCYCTGTWYIAPVYLLTRCLLSQTVGHLAARAYSASFFISPDPDSANAAKTGLNQLESAREEYRKKKKKKQSTGTTKTKQNKTNENK